MEDNTCIFTKDLSRAKLYLPRKEIIQFYEFVSTESKRNIRPFEVEISYTISGESNFFETLIEKETKLFEKLNKQAEKDVDSMSEKDYKKWKQLKRKLTVI